MNKLKSFTSIEDSKILADILPLESADMHYATWTILNGEFIVSPNQGSTIEDLQEDYGNQIIPCWSLAALLEVMNEPELIRNSEGKWLIRVWYYGYLYSKGGYYNPIDACVGMIEKLHKLNLL